MQQIGISNVAMAAIRATAEKPAASNAEADIVATAAIPNWEDALRIAIYPPRTSATTISVVSACKGAWRAEAAMLSIAIPMTSHIPSGARATVMNRNARITLDQMMTFRFPA